jgi:hypothetical protein
MKELIEYRTKLVEKLDQTAQEFHDAFIKSDPSMKLDGGWTAHQVASHVRDIQLIVYGARARRTLQEENPLFQSIDPDEHMKKNYRQDEPLEKILDEFKGNVDELCRELNAAPIEAWSRLSQHETLGDSLTLQWWVERSLAHIEEHLQTLAKAGGRRGV